MKKPATIKPLKHGRFNLFYLSKVLGGVILSFMAYLIISNFNSTSKLIDIESILPPSGHILKSIAIPRVSGTRSNARVREFIKSQFKSKYWDIEEDSHTINTAIGKETSFVNLIITHKNTLPDTKKIILSAHYDSKFLEAESLELIPDDLESKFIGATDSAWSCSLIIFLARSLESRTDLKRNIQLIFFDGEEAIRKWSESDSLYGSRALASKWSKLPVDHRNSLGNIDLMILLDLLGSGDSSNFYSFHPENSKIDLEFKKLIQIERDQQIKKDDKNYKYNELFKESSQFKNYKGQAIEDDHTPFLPFGVPVLHLIPLPFPTVWHTQADSIEALDAENCKKLSEILYEYVEGLLK